MEFKKHDILSCMVAKTTFKNYEVEIRLTIDEKNYEEVAINLISYMNEIWEDIESGIIHGLYPTYAEEWSSKSNQFTKEEFLFKIVPKVIEYEQDEDERSYTVLFDDSGLFGDHIIELFWDYDEKITKDLFSISG